MKFPLLIHVGYPKSASTYLQRQIFKKLQVKGVARFSFGSLSKLLADEDCANSEDFWNDERLPRILSQEKFSGLPFGSSDKECESIASKLSVIAPEAKILMITREQYSYCDSAYRWYISSDSLGTRKPKSFFRKNENLGSFLSYHSAYFRWKTVFHQVEVLPFELLLKSPGAFAEAVCDMLSLPNAYQGVFENAFENKGLKREYTNAFRRLNYFFRPASDALELVTRGTFNRRSFRRTLRDKYLLPLISNPLVASKPVYITDSVKIWEREWMDSNRKLQKIVDWDLKELGYKV